MKLFAYIYKYGAVHSVIQIPNEFLNIHHGSNLSDIISIKYRSFKINGHCSEVNVTSDTEKSVTKAVHFYVPSKHFIHSDLIPNLIQAILKNDKKGLNLFYQLVSTPFEGKNGEDIQAILDLTAK
jgi:hypothetical protein